MNKKLLTPGEIQSICMEMLRQVDQICKAENIQYFLSGGTLLGAIRHKRFIPWDDDIDLMMPRPEYERFLAIAPKYLPERYTLAFPDKVDGYMMPWIRIIDNHTRIVPDNTHRTPNHNLFIDIFPIDGLPTNKTLSDLFFMEIRLHDALLKCARRRSFKEGEHLKWLKRILMLLTSVRSVRSYAVALDRIAKRYNFEEARYAGACVVTHYGKRERMPAEVFHGTVDVPFVDGMYPAPIGYEIYLHNLYGDYMQLPPENQRYSPHELQAWIVSEEEGA